MLLSLASYIAGGPPGTLKKPEITVPRTTLPRNQLEFCCILAAAVTSDRNLEVPFFAGVFHVNVPEAEHLLRDLEGHYPAFTGAQSNLLKAF